MRDIKCVIHHYVSCVIIGIKADFDFLFDS